MNMENNNSVSVYGTFSVLLDSDSVTHIVAENNSYLEVLDWLRGQAVGDSSRFELLDISWLTACIEAGRPVDSEMKYRLRVRHILQCKYTIYLFVCLFSLKIHIYACVMVCFFT